MNRSDLVGRWRRVTGAAPYPLVMTFRENGIYEAEKDPNLYTIWDAGLFRLEGDHTITLSTANDAEISYPLHVDGDIVEIRDDQGNIQRYQRE